MEVYRNEFLDEDQPKKHCWRLKDHLSRNRIPYDESRSGNAFTITVHSMPSATQIYANPARESEQQKGQGPYPF